MNRKTVLLTYASILLLSCLGIGARSVKPVRAAITWTVDDDGLADFTSIQEAINAASPGDTIFVFSGTYCEHVVVNKTVSLVGENKTSTVIDCNGTSFGIRITASNVKVTRFTVRNSASGFSGIEVLSSYNTITGNVVSMNYIGINLMNSSYNVVSDNTVVSSSHRGIYVRAVGGESSNNVIVCNNVQNSTDGINLSSSRDDIVARNTVLDSPFGIYLAKCRDIRIVGNEVIGCGWGIEFYGLNDSMIVGNMVSNTRFGISLSRCNNIKVYHNNLINGADQTFIYLSYNLTWDSGYPSGGNYWSDYTGVDLHSSPHQNVTGSDGIGDIPYIIDTNNKDNYPLMGMFWDFNATSEYHVQTICNSTVSDSQFDQRESTISFNVTGEDGTTGFCRIMIPRGLMEPYGVVIDEKIIDSTELPVSNRTHAFLYFTYIHSTHKVTIVPKLLYLYYDLLDKYTELLEAFTNLNSTCRGLRESIEDLVIAFNLTRDNLQEQIDSFDSTFQMAIDDLQERVDLLNSTLQTSVNELLELYNSLNSALTSEQEAVINELSTIRNLLYVFIATTIILIATTVHLAKRKPEIKP